MPQEGIELALRLVGVRRLPRGLRQALEPLRLAIGRRAGGIDGGCGLVERCLTGPADFFECAPDLILSGDADADRDVAVGQGSLPLA